MLKQIRKIFGLFYCIISKNRYLKKIKSQSSNRESEFLESLDKFIIKKNFFEIGFGIFEFNCSNLIKKKYSGYLVDADFINCLIMNILRKVHQLDLKIKNIFIEKDNITHLIQKDLGGILSIDIDGNDYWILKEILNYNKNFEIIIVEYNASFLDFCVSVPYDKNFNRHKKHDSGWYHGASLNAFIKLLNLHNYCLIKTVGGINAIFIKREILNKNSLKQLTFEESYEEGYLRNKWSSTNATHQFDKIKHLSLIEV